MAKELKLDKCNACDGSGHWQINEPLQLGICSRCNGTGKDRIVQILPGPNSMVNLIALTANGLTFIYVSNPYKSGWEKYC